MILTHDDFSGSLSDHADYVFDYGKNEALFVAEFDELESLQPGDDSWYSSLYHFKIYKGIEGYRIAMPVVYHPFQLEDRLYFQDFLLSKTIFPNRYQAMNIASRILSARMGT